MPDPMVDITHPSPNHNARPAGVLPRLIVLHSTAGASDRGDVDWCQKDRAALRELWERTPPSKRPAKPWEPVSYHAIVGRLGTVYTLVPWHRRAWHAGKSAWNGVSDVNNYSIGLSFSNRHDSKEALTPVQRAVMAGVVQYLAVQYPSLEGVVTHALVAPGRKSDPNESPGFDLAEYVEAFRVARWGTVAQNADLTDGAS